MPFTPVKVPNRLSATAMAHRSAAQNGQYSAPMYSISGLPLLVSGAPVTRVIDLGFDVPPPTVFSVAAGTVAMLFRVLALRVVPVAEPVLADVLWFALKITKPTTMAITTTTAPEARNTRLRTSARRAAARCAAPLSRADPFLLFLLALPMACLPWLPQLKGC